MGERVGTKAALLHALFAGPADTVALADRVARLGLGDPRIGSAELGRCLRDLVRSGLLRRWREPSRPAAEGRGVFYELTSAGVAKAETLQGALSGLAEGGGSRRARRGSKAFERRLKRSLDISALAGALRLLRRRRTRSASRR